jgi:hypothetical protein
MAIKFKSEFKDQFKPSLYTGFGLLRIAKDTKGNLVINPDRATLSEFLSNVPKEGEPIDYSGKVQMDYGWTAYSDKGGLKRISKEEYDKLDAQTREQHVIGEELDKCRISFLVEGELEEKGEDGKLRTVKMYDTIQFTLVDSSRYSGDGKKALVINKWGETAWVESDNAYRDKFKATDKDGVQFAFDKVGNLGIEELIDFIYSYGAFTKGQEDLIQYIDFNACFTGDVSSITDLMTEIENQRVGKDDKGKTIDLFGIVALATPTNNKGTNNMNSHAWYPVFARGIVDTKGNINKDGSKIKSAVIKSRTPNKKDGIAYSPEHKGVYVGTNGIPQYGFKRFDEKLMERFVLENASNNHSRPAAVRSTGANAGGGAVIDADNDPFGI